jgi:hypothetical protein
MNIIIKPSTKPDKKYMAIIDDKKTVHFGAAGMSDYTKHKDKERKERYLARHRKNEQWDNPLTASFYATNILWNKPTLTESIKDTNRRFKNINIKMR